MNDSNTNAATAAPRSIESFDLAPFRGRVKAAAIDPTGAAVQGLLDEVRAMADGSRLDPSTNDIWQRQLHWLHYGDDEPSHGFRQWLAATGYSCFASSLIVAADPAANAPGRSMDEFVAELARQQREESPLHHRLLVHCYSDDASFDDFRTYLRHKWIIMLTFWRSLAEFGDRLQRHDRTDLANTALAYGNVHEELGGGSVDSAHMVRHHRLLRHIGLDVTWEDEPEFTETYEYINFRMFCMRHPDPAWGLGSFYSQEATSLEYTIGHYQQLRRHGISHDMAEIYHAHDEIDAEHTDEVVTMIRSLVDGPTQQAAVLAAQRHQMRLWNAHFDRVLDQIEAGGRP